MIIHSSIPKRADSSSLARIPENDQGQRCKKFKSTLSAFILFQYQYPGIVLTLKLRFVTQYPITDGEFWAKDREL
jgi:hypothetical protein